MLVGGFEWMHSLGYGDLTVTYGPTYWQGFQWVEVRKPTLPARLYRKRFGPRKRVRV